MKVNHIVDNLSDKILDILVYYDYKKMLSDYKLCKESTIFKNYKISIPPIVRQRYFELDFNKLKNLYLGNSIIEFVNLMTDKFSSDYLINFYNNINNLSVIKSTEPYSIVSTYDAISNTIEIVINSTIYHELFHMASTKYIGNISYSGFSQLDINTENSDIGTAINEGYTQLLAERYFKKAKAGGYKYEQSISKSLEVVIGKEKMENLYLDANLPGLIEELKQYAKEDEIKDFIISSDFCHKYKTNKKEELSKKEMFEICLKKTYKFLVIIYVRKLKNLLLRNDITKEQFINDFKEYIPGNCISIKGITYKLFSLEEYNNILKTILEESKFDVNLEVTETVKF